MTKDPRRPWVDEVAELSRTYQYLGHGLAEYASRGSAVAVRGARGKKVRSAPHLRREMAVRLVRAGLGVYPYQLDSAITAVRHWHASIDRPTAEDEETKESILALLAAYMEPKRFFQEVAPKLDPWAFDPRRLDPSRSEDSGLAHTLEKWGCGAFLNEAVYLAFVEAGPWLQNCSIDAIHGRKLRRVGRPPARALQVSLLLRDRRASISGVAAKMGIREESVDRHVSRRAAKRPKLRADDTGSKAKVVAESVQTKKL